MKQIRTRLTYANVMSTIAVFLVLGGATAFAAAQLGKGTVGSKQLKNGAVTSAKIKKGAVTKDKISSAAQTALRGALGPVGPRGLQGLQGPQGARGPSNGRFTSVPGNVELGKSEEKAKVIASLNLAPGKWMVSAETALVNASGETRSAWCSLNAGSTELGRTRAMDNEADPGAERQISADATVLGAVDLPAGGTVEFRCWAPGPLPLVFTPAQSRPALQAIQVETLEVQ
jgi:hypothetical protein